MFIQIETAIGMFCTNPLKGMGNILYRHWWMLLEGTGHVLATILMYFHSPDVAVINCSQVKWMLVSWAWYFRLFTHEPEPVNCCDKEIFVIRVVRLIFMQVHKRTR